MAAPTASSMLDAALRHDQHAFSSRPCRALTQATWPLEQLDILPPRQPSPHPTRPSSCPRRAPTRSTRPAGVPRTRSCRLAPLHTPRTPRPTHPLRSDANDAAVSSAATRSPPRRSTPCHCSLCATTQVRCGRRARRGLTASHGHHGPKPCGSDTNCWGCPPAAPLWLSLSHRRRWKKTQDTRVFPATNTATGAPTPKSFSQTSWLITSGVTSST
jgi:hypothetical protein